MLAAVFILSFLSACGFYAYVFAKLNQEHRSLKTRKNRLPERLYQTKQGSARYEAESSSAAVVPSFVPTTLGGGKAEGTSRREALAQIGLTLGGLAALFAGIVLFNSLVTWLHWN
jgi:hypothetical protein